MDKWDKRFLQEAMLKSKWSKDPSTGIGAVIARGKVAISSGFNGYPSGINDNENDSRDVKLAKTIHAEVNAILFARQDLSDCTLYVTPIPPCDRCATLIIQAGIKRVVVGLQRDLDIARWNQYCDMGQDMFIEAGVQVERYYLD